MQTRRWVLNLLGAFALALAAVPAPAQEIVTTGPPPALRANFEAFVKAFNSTDATAWETMAKTVFTPAFLKSQTPAQRQKDIATLRKQFGTIAIERVERRGPDAPAQVYVKGSTASGLFTIDLDDASKFDSLKGEVQKTDPPQPHEHRRH